MAKVSQNEPICTNPFGFMAGTVIDGSEALTDEAESWNESPSDPLSNDPKANETAGSGSASSAKR